MTPPDKRRAILLWLTVILWMGVVFMASTSVGSPTNSSRFLEPMVRWFLPGTTPQQFEAIHHLVRKAGHLTEYAVLGLLLVSALRVSSHSQAVKRFAQSAALAVICSAAFAATDEFHQSFVAERHAQVSDVVIDSIGACAGLGLVGTYRRVKWSVERKRKTA